ncbi:MAG: MFS transporter, partial [Staphylococcus equorum]|nr:MFS transporter [Staphylococcus equorum]
NDTIKDIEVSNTKVPFMDLFKENRALSTILFWLAFFCCLLMIFGLNTWLPNLMMRAGYELNSSLMFLIVLQVGAIVGTLIIGKLCDKFGSKKLLVPLYIAGAISLSLLSLGKDVNIFVIYILIAIAGAATIGSQNLVQAFVSQYFPAYIRSTALGTASGIGRVGGMIGPLMGGFLLTFALPMPMYFIAFAIPGLIAALALYLIPMQHASEEYKKTYQVKDVPKDVPNEVK